jgi:hypothetical protein
MEVKSQAFLSFALHGGEWSASRLGHLTAGERAPGTHWIGGWVGRNVYLDAVPKRKRIPTPAGNRTPVALPVA